MSETPRTDAILLEINEGRTYTTYGPFAEHARQLERELASRDRYLADLHPQIALDRAIIEDQGRRLDALQAERDAAMKDAERHRAMRAQFANGAHISIYLPIAQPRFVDESTYLTPEFYEYDIDRAIAVNKHDAAIDAAKGGR